jgi:hypothetical protein
VTLDDHAPGCIDRIPFLACEPGACDHPACESYWLTALRAARVLPEARPRPIPSVLVGHVNLRAGEALSLVEQSRRRAGLYLTPGAEG